MYASLLDAFFNHDGSLECFPAIIAHHPVWLIVQMYVLLASCVKPWRVQNLGGFKTLSDCGLSMNVPSFRNVPIIGMYRFSWYCASEDAAKVSRNCVRCSHSNAFGMNDCFW